MLFVLNIDELIIFYIILNYQINKRVILAVSCYTITNRVVFEFIIFDLFINCIFFELANTIECMLLIRPMNTN